MNTDHLIELLDFYEKNNYLQGNLLVSLNNQTIINKSYGHSVIEHQIDNNETTRFKIGSLTKAFTSLIILKLSEQKKLNICESVGKYLKGFERFPEITIYHCMTNTSGLTDFCDKEDYWPFKMRTSMTPEEIIWDILKEDVTSIPGTNFSYSSTGYLVLTKIIEKVSGKSYSEVLQTNILHPLKMVDSGCMDEFTLIPNLASSYSFWEKEIRAIETNMSFPTGAFGMYSTTTDLLKWGRAICEEKLLFPEHFRTYLSPDQEMYACGWDCTKIGGIDFIQHQGDVDGFVSSIKIARREQLVIIFLSNLEVTAVTQITRKIATCLLEGTTDIPREKKVSISRELLKKICGNYFYVENNTHKKQRLSICSDDFGELFLVVEKRFAILYKFHLISFKKQADKHILRCDKIDETIEWTTDGRLIYTNLNKETFELISAN